MAMTRLAPLLIVLVLFLAGCEALDIRPRAVGREGEIVVVTDSANWNGPLGKALREELGLYIGTLPAPEPMFQTRRASIVSSRSLDTIRKQKNIVFAAPLSDSTREAQYLRSTLDPEAAEQVMNAGTVAVLGRRDLWAQEQQVYYIIGRDAADMAQAVRENADGIRYNFNTITRQRMGREMFEKGRQQDLEEQILAKHGFTVRAQHDYVVAADTTNFIWMRRIISSDSWRSFFVWYTDELSPADLTPEWALSVRDRLTTAYVLGNLGGHVEVDQRRPLEWENVDFLGRFGYEIRGLWHMVGPDESGSTVPFGMGGPFLSYAFYDEPTGRTYLLDGMVFAPGFEKREFLRQMEVIAHTFKTQEEITAAAEAE